MGVNMRNPDRINRILKMIEEIWKKNPDLRLCQLIGNVFPAGDNYRMEDDELENGLKFTYERYLNDKPKRKN